MSQNDERNRRALEQIAEVKRVLCSIEHALGGRRPASLLLTSAANAEGKTLCAASLAATAADSGRGRVIVLDLNWHRPAMHHFFGCELVHPLARFQEDDLSELVFTPKGQSLDVLLAPVDHAKHEHTNDDLFAIGQRLIEQAKQSYDLVIVDGAAIFPTNRRMLDPVMLAKLLDGVIMLVLNGVTPKQHVKKAQKILETAGVNIIGVVTNQQARG